MRRASTKADVLLVNHGYPPEYNAGSEIDTQHTALGLQRAGQRVAVFARESDVFAPDFALRTRRDVIDASIPVHLVNNPREAAYARFANDGIDDAFRRVLNSFRPRVVHFGHVNHLSCNLPAIAKAEFNATTVFTLHDFFLSCPRGQFLVVGPAPAGRPIYEQCTRQVDDLCARRCMSCRFGPGLQHEDAEAEYWTGWVRGRMQAFRDMATHVDAFTSPSQHLLRHFTAGSGSSILAGGVAIPTSKMHFLPYGFDHARLAGRVRQPQPQHLAHGKPLVLGYIGRHVPAKGIDLLVEAAHLVVRRTPAAAHCLRVLIFGREDGANTASIRRRISTCQEDAVQAGVARSAIADLVTFRPEYSNPDIVARVFNEVDGIVVPSVWQENSPLVIHEAQQVRVPVITSNAGGMGELVRDGVNGFTFTHRSAPSLADAIDCAMADADAFARLGERGYLHATDANVPSISQQVDKLLAIYAQAGDAEVRRQ